MVANSIEVSTTAAARPPGSTPTMAMAKPTRRLAMPPTCISRPART
jgi:hypothetical protein